MFLGQLGCVQTKQTYSAPFNVVYVLDTKCKECVLVVASMHLALESLHQYG